MRKHGQDPGDGVEVRDETDVVQVIEKLCKYVNKVLKIYLRVSWCYRNVFI